VSHENSGRSWAEILEQSSESFNRTGPSVNAVPVADLSCSGDDVVTPEMLNALKVRIHELKLRQQQLQRDQLLHTQRRPETSTTNSFSAASTAPSVAQPVNILSSVSNPGTVQLLNNSDKIAADVKTSVHDQNGPQQSSAARSLLFEFTASTPVVPLENSTHAVVPSTSITDVVICQTSSLDVKSPATVAATVATSDPKSGVDNCCRLIPGSQQAVVSSDSNHRCEISSDTPRTAAEAASVEAVARSMSTTVMVDVDSNGLLLPHVYSSAVPQVSALGMPMGLQICIVDENVNSASFIPNPGSAGLKTRSSSLQPVCVISCSDVAARTEVLASQSVSTSSNIDTLTLPAVVTSQSLSSDLTTVRLPVSSDVVVGRATVETGPVLVEDHLDGVLQPVVKPMMVLSGLSGVLSGVSSVPSGVSGVLSGLSGVPSGLSGVPLGLCGVPPGLSGVPSGLSGVPSGLCGVPPGLSGVPSGLCGVPPGLSGVPSGLCGVPPRLSGVMEATSVNCVDTSQSTETLKATFQQAGCVPTETFLEIPRRAQTENCDDVEKYCDDVGNFLCVSDALSVLPGSACDTDMIQQSDEEARQQSRSVYRCLTYLCR